MCFRMIEENGSTYHIQSDTTKVIETITSIYERSIKIKLHMQYLISTLTSGVQSICLGQPYEGGNQNQHHHLEQEYKM